jgi:hypothetical protein
MQKWEYRVIQFGSYISDLTTTGMRLGTYEDIGKVLALLGDEGWEYVGDTALSRSIFKRPKP